MDQERNIDSILTLEKRIEEYEGHDKTTIQFGKCARSSLLDVSTLLPPELFGNIFCCNVIPDKEFCGLLKGSYNFLLICHHRFEVASCAPN